MHGNGEDGGRARGEIRSVIPYLRAIGSLRCYKNFFVAWGGWWGGGESLLTLGQGLKLHGETAWKKGLVLQGGGRFSALGEIMKEGQRSDQATAFGLPY